METNQQTGADTAATPRPVAVETQTCPNCHAALLRGMRFCRTCGFRLGEGIAEYVETMRFDGAALPTVATPAAGATMQTPVQPTTTLAVCRPRGVWRMRWLMWTFILLMFFSVGGGIAVRGLRALRALPTFRGSTLSAPPRSLFGANPTFVTVEEGAMIPSVIPNSPADRAGFIGGDIITPFDGQAGQKSDDVTGP